MCLWTVSSKRPTSACAVMVLRAPDSCITVGWTISTRSDSTTIGFLLFSKTRARLLGPDARPSLRFQSQDHFILERTPLTQMKDRLARYMLNRFHRHLAWKRTQLLTA